MTDKQKQQELLEKKRYYNVASTNIKSERRTPSTKYRPEDPEAEKKRQKLLSYLASAKKSAIKRGMFNQNPYKKTAGEGKANV